MKINCPHCNTILEIDNDIQDGQTFNCPKCGNPIKITKPKPKKEENIQNLPKAPEIPGILIVKTLISMLALIGFFITLHITKCDPTYLLYPNRHPERMLFQDVPEKEILFHIDKGIHLLLAVVCLYVVYRIIHDMFCSKN